MMEQNPILLYAVLAAAGIAAGYINTLAGGGSMIPVGIMIMCGIPPTAANATNRPGVLAASIGSTRVFLKEKQINRREAVIMGALAVPGAIAGALWASRIDSDLFRKILGVIMILTALAAVLPAKKGEPKHSFLIYPAVILIGFYGGFVQIGVGIIMTALFRRLQNLPLIEVNARKMAVTLFFTIPPILIFWMNGLILWGFALVLAAGNLLGGYIAARQSLKGGEKAAKAALLIMSLVIAVELFR